MDGAYRELPAVVDAAGVLRRHSAVFGLDICVLPGLELRLYDPAPGEWLRTHQETADALRSSETARREAETARRAEAAARRAAEAENAQLREQLRQLRRQ